jgi:hypothetical protein
MLEIERGSTRSHAVKNSLWKSLWTCRKANDGMNEVNDEIGKGPNGSIRLGSLDCCRSEVCICFYGHGFSLSVKYGNKLQVF